MAAVTASRVAGRRREQARPSRQQAEAAERGARAERLTAKVLGQLPVGEWTVFCDFSRPGRAYADIDHVLVGPSGVFVIDTLDWSGSIHVRRDVLRQNGRQRDKALARVVQAASAVAGLVPEIDPRRVQPVICFARDEKIMGWVQNVMVCSTATVVPMLLTQPTVLSAEEREALCRDIGGQLRAATEAAAGRVPRKAAPRHSAATNVAERPDRRARRRAPKKRSSGMVRTLLKSAVLTAGAALVATNPGPLVDAGHAVARLLG